MKAVYIQEHGGPEVLTYGKMPEPSTGQQEVKVKVQAVSLNRLDVYTRAGIRGTRRSFPPPLILGGDTAGDIVEVGRDVVDRKIGERVVVNPHITCGQCAHCLDGRDELCANMVMLGSTVDGSYAEYVTIPSINAHPVADHVSYEQAASMPTVFLPVWSILVRRANTKSSDTVLVLSASAGVGTAAIQVAKRVIGCRVIATTSTDEKAARVSELGADAVINYRTEDLPQRISELTDGEGVDVVVDHVGADFFPPAFASLKPGGRYGICGVTTGYKTEVHLGQMFTKHLSVFGVFMGARADMVELVGLLNQRKIQPSVDRVFPLEQAAQAHQAMDALDFVGKLVLIP